MSLLEEVHKYFPYLLGVGQELHVQPAVDVLWDVHRTLHGEGEVRFVVLSVSEVIACVLDILLEDLVVLSEEGAVFVSCSI